MIFRNRREAGRALASQLERLQVDDAVILGLPRGGVPVAFEVAMAVRAPLDVFVVRKLGVPGFEELAMGAMASGGIRILNESVIERLHIPSHVIEAAARREGIEIARRLEEYREDRPPLVLAGRSAVLVDDGLATGATMRAAVAAVRVLSPARVIVGVPVASPVAVDEFADLVDEIVCVFSPDPLGSVGAWYADFAQTTDGEVCELLQSAWLRRPR